MYFNQNELEQGEKERLSNLIESQKSVVKELMTDNFNILDEIESSLSKDLISLFIQLAIFRDNGKSLLKVPPDGLLPQWLYRKEFVKAHEFFILRSLGVTPFLNALGVDNSLLIQELELGINSALKFQIQVSPLHIVLRSITTKDRRKLFHPFEAGSRANIDEAKKVDAVNEKSPNKYLSSIYIKKGFSEKKISTQLERNKKLISDLTGEAWYDFYKKDKLPAIRLLVLFHQLRTSTSINLRSLIRNLDEEYYFDLKPKAFNESNILATNEINDWLDIRNKKNPQVKAAVLAELFAYLYDGCDAKFRIKIQGIELWFHHIVNTFSQSAVEAHRLGNSSKFEGLLKSALQLFSDLGLPKKIDAGSYLFEKLLLALNKKIINQYYQEHKQIEESVRCSENQNFILNPSQYEEIKTTLNDPDFRLKLEAKGITLKEAKEDKLYRRILFCTGLHHLLCAAGVIQNKNELNSDDMKVIFIILLNEFEIEASEKTRIKFKKLEATSRKGPELVTDSLLKYAIKVAFQGKNKPYHGDLFHIYTAHKLYWIEKFQMTKLQIESPALPHVYRYTRSKVASLLIKEF